MDCESAAASISGIFKAYDVRAVYPDKLNEASAWKVGYAAGQYLLRKSGVAGSVQVLVSRDMRPHSEALCASLVLGLRASGLDVIDLGMCDTSFLYFAINQFPKAVGGIQTTASHNPIQYNGFKISGMRARPIGEGTGLERIRARAMELPPHAGPEIMALTGGYEQCDLWSEYRQHVLTFLEPLQRPIKVFIDASNGMAGKMIPAVFDGVENLEIVPLNFEITGSFVHEPNPLLPENMAPTQQGVREHAAHLGACFDGDADRCILTDETGEIIGCDHLTALLTGHFLPQNPGAAIVYDLRSSKVVEETIKQLGGEPKRSRVGHVFMKDVLREEKGVFGGELSGHFYFRDSFCTDSGAIALACVLSMLGKTDQSLGQLIAPFKKYPQSGEINFRVEDKQAVLDQITSEYAHLAEIDQLDGVTIDAFVEHGYWFNVRASNTEPLLRLNAEARDQAALDQLLSELKPKLGELDAGGH